MFIFALKFSSLVLYYINSCRLPALYIMSNCVIKCSGVTQFILRYVMRRIRPKTKKSMKNYRVLFGVAGNRVLIIKNLSIEEAVQFALNLHRSSNVGHLIDVEFEEGPKFDLVVSFRRSSNSN